MKIIEINNQKEFDNLPNSFNEFICIKIITNDLITVTTNRENSHVVAHGNSRVVARENSRVEAYGNSHVEAYENPHVVARENSRVVAWENSSVEAWENSSVEAWENSSVEAWENSSVVARENSILRIYSKDSNIKLLDFSIAFMHELNMKLEKSEHSLVQWMGKLNTEIKSIYKINVTTTIEIEETPKGRKFKNI